MSLSSIKNPFSIYDFLGYFLPGAFLLFVIIVIYSCGEAISFDALVNTIRENNHISFSFTDSVIFIILSYIAGHLLAYLSSITIERFSLWLFRYPSEFLLNDKDDVSYWNSGVTSAGTINTNKQSKNKDSFTEYSVLNSNNDNLTVVINIQNKTNNKYLNIVRFSLKVLMLIFLFPISICYILSKIINLKGFITKLLDEYLKQAILNKANCLICKLQLNFPDSDAADYSRIMSHYLIEHSTNHNVKFDNYVALYGFLRSIALAMDIITIYIFFVSIVSCSISENFILIAVFSVITFIFFLAFMKFYRRYTLEIFMALITSDSLLCDNIINKQI